MNKQRTGFTLIELLVTLGILGLMITALFSFFIGNVDFFKTTSDNIDIQQHGQFCMNYIVDEIIVTRDIKSNIPLNESNYSVDKKNIKSILFKITSDEQLLELEEGLFYNYTGFKYDNDCVYQIFYLDNKKIDKEFSIANYVNDINYEFIFIENKITGVRINLTLIKGNKQKNIENQVKFRNINCKD